MGAFHPWDEGAAELLAQALAAGLAEEGVPVDGSGYESVFGLECGAELTGGQPLCSKLPVDWGAAQQLQAVQSAWQDALHFDEALATVYGGFSDQQ